MQVIPVQIRTMATNCYLLCDDTLKRCGIIDPGGDAPQIIKTVEESGYEPECILLTHGHFDHTGAVAAVLEKWPELPVYVSEKDVYDSDDRQVKMLFPRIPGMLKNYGEGDVIKVGETSVQIIATPGHTAGCVTLLSEDYMFPGDTLFAGSCGRTDLLSGDHGEMQVSLRRLAGLQGNYKVLPGHMGATELDREREYNPYMRQALQG